MDMEREELFFMPVEDEENIKREKNKARELRRSQWWKNRIGTGKCYYCEEMVSPRELTMDHIVPMVRGGRSTKGNVVPCCKECNNRKKNLVPSEWKEYLQKLKNQSRENNS